MSQQKEDSLRLVFEVKVTPKANKTATAGREGERIKVRLAATPQKGEANAELIRFLAKTLGLTQAQVVLVTGDTGRLKRIALIRLSQEQHKKAEAWLANQ